MASSFSVPCPKSSSAPSLLKGSVVQSQHQQQQISFQSALVSRNSNSFWYGSFGFDQAVHFRFQRPSWKKSTIWKVNAQLNEVAAEKSSNSVLVTQEKLELPSSGKKDEPEEEKGVKSAVLDDASISAFMTQVAELVKLVDSRDIMELQLKQSDYELTIRKKEALLQAPGAPTPIVMMQPPSLPSQAMLPSQPPAPVAAASAPASAPPSAPALPSPTKASKSSLPSLKCPMAGTLYRSPAPGEPPFVKVGDKVQKGQVVCIIEAMKLMNEIEADQSGKIVEILVEDGKPVSVDMPLLIIEP